MNYLDKKVSVYKNVFDNVGSIIDLRTFLLSDKYKNEVEQIRSETDKNKRSELKKHIPAITISGIFEPIRLDENLKEHSGLLCIDIDGQDNTHIKNFSDLKKQLSNLKEVLYCGLSVSGNGYFVIVPIAYPNKHREHFRAIREDFMSYGIFIDDSCINVSRMRLYSYDSAPYINEKAAVYNRLHVPPKSTYIPYSNDATDNISTIVKKASEHSICMTDSYSDWFNIGCALASELGESGRSHFHELSRMSTKYKPHETDKKYDSCLKTNRISIGTFFQIAADYGIRFKE